MSQKMTFPAVMIVKTEDDAPVGMSRISDAIETATCTIEIVLPAVPGAPVAVILKLKEKTDD